MSEIDITLDDLMAELQSLSEGKPDGFTMKEMSKHVGRHVQWCREAMQDLIENGRARYVGKRQKTRIDGAVGWVPVFQFIDGDKK